MGTLRRFVDKIAKRFGKKQAETRVTFSVPVKPVVKKKSLPKRVMPHETGFGTFRPVKSAPFKTDFSASAVVHAKREAGLIPTRKDSRKRKAHTIEGVNP